MNADRVSDVDEACLDAIARFGTAVMNTALSRLDAGSLHRGFSSCSLRSMTGNNATTVGFAVTCREDTTTPKHGELTGFEAVYEQVSAVGGPVVVVCADVGEASPDRSCHLGEIMATTMFRLGARGFITDGGVRDVAGISANLPNFTVFARGTVPGAGQPSLVEVGQQVDVDGLGICPGDIVVGDADGVIVVPRLLARAACRAARQIVDAENEKLAALRASSGVMRRPQ